MNPATNPAIDTLHALRDNWAAGGDMGRPDGFVAVREGVDGGDEAFAEAYAVKIELWTDDCLMDLKKQDEAAARRRGEALAKKWAKEHWPHTGYVDLGGAEGVYGATWAWDKATENELERTDPDEVVRLPAARANPDVTSTPTFRRWFGDSKVVDAAGEPRVVYHGAPDVRGIFAGGFKRSSMRGDVFFATDDPRTAETYTDPHRAWDYQNAEPGVIPLYLRIENPLVVDAGFQHWRGTEHVIEQARQAGHDGVIIENTIDHYASDRKAKPRREDACTVFAFFSPTQVKSALTGPMKARDPNRWHVSTSQPLDFTGPNDGTFDLDDADVRLNPDGTAPSEATPTDVTHTKAFRRWFGDSKVVDAAGKPLVVFHGHPRNVDAFFVFDFDRAIDLGMHFGTQAAAFDIIGVGHAVDADSPLHAYVRPFYLSLQNPLGMSDPGDWIAHAYGSTRVPVLEELYQKGIITAEEYEATYEKVRALSGTQAARRIDADDNLAKRRAKTDRRAAISRLLRDLIVDAGYDGVVYENENEDVGSRSWIAFYPEQIKLADGTNTTFDPANPDVRLNPAALRKKDFLALLAVPENRKAVEKFVDVVRAYQSDSAGYKSALANRYLALPASVQDAISEPKANLKKLYRGDDGKSRARATSWTSSLDYAKLFGQYVFPYAALASHGGTINTHKLVRLLDFAFEDHDVGDDEDEVVILEPVWKSADSDDGYLVKNVKGYWFPRENPDADAAARLGPVVDTEEWDDGTVVEFVAVPFPVERKPLSYKDDPEVSGFVRVEDLIATQRRVTKAGVEKYLDDIAGRVGRAEKIRVYETHDGRRYIADGHHRAVAAWAAGVEVLPAVIQLVRE